MQRFVRRSSGDAAIAWAVRAIDQEPQVRIRILPIA
jgi:hypothetical protein